MEFIQHDEDRTHPPPEVIFGDPGVTNEGRSELNGWFEEAQLPLLSAGQRNGVAFRKAGVAILAWCAR